MAMAARLPAKLSQTPTVTHQNQVNVISVETGFANPLNSVMTKLRGMERDAPLIALLFSLPGTAQEGPLRQTILVFLNTGMGSSLGLSYAMIIIRKVMMAVQRQDKLKQDILALDLFLYVLNAETENFTQMKHVMTGTFFPMTDVPQRVR